MKALHLIFVAKAIALLGLGGFFYANYQAKAQGQESSEKSSESKQDPAKKSDIPDIPEKGLSLSKAAELRNQLLILRRDIEQKIERLNTAKQAYDRSKSNVDSQLKRIEEERRLLEETLQKERKAKEERLSEALEFVVKMEPKKAAPLLESMDRDLVMQLLRKLPPRQVSKLLEAVSPKKATEFLEYYTRIRSGREYELFRELGLCQGSGNEEGTNAKPTNEKDNPRGQTGGNSTSATPASNGTPASASNGPSTTTTPAAIGTPSSASTGPSATSTALPSGTQAASARGAANEAKPVR